MKENENDIIDWFEVDLQKPIRAVVERGQDWTLGYDPQLCHLLAM